MPGQGFSGIAGYNRFRTRDYAGGGAFGNPFPTYGYPSYYDTPGGRVLSGGSLNAPQGRGMPGRMPGIEFPGTPDPGIANDPIYGNTLNLPRGGIEIVGGGGAGEFSGGAIPRANMPYPYPDMNIPPNEDVAPGLSNEYYTDPRNFTTPRFASGGDDWVSGNDFGARPKPSRYPVPGLGSGLSSEFGGGQSWRENATRGGGFAGFANQRASNAGFGGGLISSGGGGWQTVSNIPDLGGMSPMQAFGGGGTRVFQL